MELTEQEKKLLAMIREEKPYEVIEIRKDKGGKADSYFVVRTQKIVVENLQSA